MSDVTLTQELLDISRKTLEPIYIKKFNGSTPGWSSFINALNYKFNGPDKESVVEEDNMFVLNSGYKTDIFMFEKFCINYWYIIKTGVDKNTRLFNFFEEAKSFSDIFDNLLGKDSYSMKAIMNLVGNESKHHPHKDFQDVFSWNCVGQVEYRIYDDFESEFGVELDISDKTYKSYFLEEDDLMFLPAGVIHQAIVDRPRATLLIDL